MIDCAAGVALLTDLGYLDEHLSHGQPCANWEGGEVNPFGSYIFRKVAGIHVKAHALHFFDALQGQKAHLPVPLPGVGIADNAVLLPQFHRGDGGFPLSLIFAYTDGNDFSGHLVASIQVDIGL
jgi:hypothetical protein